MSQDATVTRMLSRYGADHTLRRVVATGGANAWTAGADVVSYSKLRAREIKSDAKPLGGGLVQNVALITVDAKTAIVAPVRGDRIALGEFSNDAGAEWRQITDVYPVRENGKIAVYKLTVSQ